MSVSEGVMGRVGSVYNGHGFENCLVIGRFDAAGNALSQRLVSQHD